MSGPPPLHSVWPEVARRLELRLRRRGADPVRALDLVQDVAVRVLSARPSFESAEDLLRWATVVARHLAVDGHRSDRRLVPSQDDHASALDVEAHVLDRLDLDALWRALPGLTLGERRALTRPEEAPADRAAQVRAAVRRHRARSHLARILEGDRSSLDVPDPPR